MNCKLASARQDGTIPAATSWTGGQMEKAHECDQADPTRGRPPHVAPRSCPDGRRDAEHWPSGDREFRPRESGKPPAPPPQPNREGGAPRFPESRKERAIQSPASPSPR